MKNKQLKVALYLRTAKNNNAGIKKQEKELIKYCDMNNYLIYDFYVDNGYNNNVIYRPSFNRMLDDINNEKVDLVIACNLDRFYRDTGNFLAFKIFVEQHNCKIDSIDLHTTNTVYEGTTKMLNVLIRNGSNE